MSTYNLEKPIEGLLAALANAPAFNTMAPADARAMVNSVQSEPVPMPVVDVSVVTVPVSVGDVQVHLIRPGGVTGSLPAVLYMHGGGWILGSFISHRRLARELAVGANAVVAFVEYSLAPEARYPVQIKQCYAAAKWLIAQASEHGNDSSAWRSRATQPAGTWRRCLRSWPSNAVTCTSFTSRSTIPLLTLARTPTAIGSSTTGRMERRQSWDGSWTPPSRTRQTADRTAITVSPLQATPADLEGLPPALVIVDENDVLRDQGEAYANKFRDAGVPVTSVRFNGTMHDFMMLKDSPYVTPNRPARRSGSASRRCVAPSSPYR